MHSSYMRCLLHFLYLVATKAIKEYIEENEEEYEEWLEEEYEQKLAEVYFTELIFGKAV